MKCRCSLFAIQIAALSLIALGLGPSVGQPPATRMQATLRSSGQFVGNGYQISSIEPGGPLAQMLSLDGNTRGTAEPGDVIVSIDGEQFSDRRSFLDLLDRQARAGGGTVRLAIKDQASGSVMTWKVTTVQSEVPWDQPVPGEVPNPATDVENVVDKDAAAIASVRSQVADDPLLPMKFQLGLGAHVEGASLLVESVAPNGPATNMSRPDRPGIRGILEVGDVLLRIHDVELLGEQAETRLHQVVADNNGAVRLAVRDRTSGEVVEWHFRALPSIDIAVPLSVPPPPPRYVDELGPPPKLSRTPQTTMGTDG